MRGAAFRARLVGASGMRLVLGVLAAGLAANFAPMLAFFLVWLPSADAVAVPESLAALPGLFVFYPFALAMTVLGGVPVHLLLVARRSEAGWAHLGFGPAAGAVGLGAIEIAASGSLGVLPVLGALAGLAAAAAFRAVWRPLPVSG